MATQIFTFLQEIDQKEIDIKMIFVQKIDQPQASSAILIQRVNI